jgi:rifampicin phosphotransferase
VSASPFVIPLSEARDVALAGGKAINLARLMAAGLPVPDGFVITTAAYRAAGGATTVPAEIATLVREAYERMGSPMVAARSSATAEDMAEASMAGQYETFLNLSGADALLEAVAHCWQSMHSDRLRAYLREQGIAPECVAMAVVVQRLVPADAAGVLFTADPQTGVTKDMLIEAAWGLGEGVVSGAVQPDRIRVRAIDGSVLQYQVAEKTTRLCPGGRGFEAVLLADRSRACLQHETIHQLWQLGRRAARHFDGPQDMEWAVADGKVYLLQSRAITTLREAALRHGLPETIRRELAARLDAGRGPWVRHNLDETLPHPTPLTWSLLRPFMSGAGGFGKMYDEVGFKPSAAVRTEGFLDLIGGRVYMDCARMPEMFSEGYPFAYDAALLRANPDAAQQPPTVVKGTLREQGAAGALGQRVTDKLRLLAVDLDRRFDTEFAPAVAAWCREESTRDLGALNHEELVVLWEQRRAKVLDEFGVMAFLPSMVEALATSELRAFLEEHSWDEEPDVLLHQMVVGAAPDQTFLANARLQEVGQGKRTRSEWLAEFGARGPGEFDLVNPRWNERPADLDEMSARLAGEASLLETHARRQQEATAAVQRLSAKLSPDLRQELARRVELAARYVRFREDGKHQLMRAYALLRPLALEFGRRLEIGEDVFLLESAEMIEALRTGFVPKDGIAHRRLLRRAETSLTLSRVIDRQDLPGLGVPVVAADASRWTAHPLSSGTCTGPARIVRSPESAGDLGKGYVLVCPSTDPSWTPLFVGAAGLILECGGALSHGAIVARELGLPAVVLEDATRLFQNGERLTLDANGGQVIRGAEAASATSVTDADNPRVERALQPPAVGARERASAQRGLLAAVLWGVFLLAVWFLPAALLQDPLFGLLDTILWPLVPRLGMPGTVAVIAAFFALLPLVLQKFFTDNERLVAARDRSARLRKLAGALPKESARRQAMEKLASPVTLRVLKAALTSLAFVLGPMMLVFLWLPARLDPASWNAAPGREVTMLAEVRGDWSQPLNLRASAPLEIDVLSAATQTLPPIRATLEELRAEWSQRSDTAAYPWELQAAADHVHEAMLGSLDAFLAGEIPAQKLSWRISVPAHATGHHTVRLETGTNAPTELTLAFGNTRPPALAEVIPESGPVQLLKATYPRPLQKHKFWSPLPKIGGPAWDFGWLGVYLIAYLPVMMLGKRLLRVA